MGMINQYLALCWFSASPLELPRSTHFFKINLVFNFLVFSFIHLNMTDDIESISEVIIETLLNLGFIALTLLLDRSMHAYIQVASSVLFCENVAAILLIPIMLWATVAEDVWGYGTLGSILVWVGIMIAAVFKKVLRINMLAGLAMSLFYFLFSFGGGFAINSFLTG